MNKIVQFGIGCSAAFGSSLGAMLQRKNVSFEAIGINTLLGGMLVVLGFAAVKFIAKISKK